MTRYTRCGDCAVLPGEKHTAGCDVARCPVCGFQDIGCNCPKKRKKGRNTTWTGRWPGEVEVEEGLATDLNDLANRAGQGLLRWNADRERWVKHAQP